MREARTVPVVGLRGGMILDQEIRNRHGLLLVVQGQVLTASKFNDYNSFEQPGRVVPAAYNGAKKDGADLVADLPPMSVVVLALKN